jgi:hypothetical protein
MGVSFSGWRNRENWICLSIASENQLVNIKNIFNFAILISEAIKCRGMKVKHREKC